MDPQIRRPQIWGETKRVVLTIVCALTCRLLYLSPPHPLHPPQPLPLFPHFPHENTLHHPPEPDPKPLDTNRNSHPFAKTTPSTNYRLASVLKSAHPCVSIRKQKTETEHFITSHVQGSRGVLIAEGTTKSIRASNYCMRKLALQSLVRTILRTIMWKNSEQNSRTAAAWLSHIMEAY